MVKVVYAGNFYSSYFEVNDSVKQGIEFIIAGTKSDFEASKLGENPDFILFDDEGRFNWREAIFQNEVIKEKQIPFIILATKISEDAAIEAFRLGASDYIGISEIPRLTELLLSKKAIKEFLPDTSDIIFKKIVEHSSDGILILDQGGKITYASPSVKTLLGYEPSELLNLNLIHFLHPDDQLPVNDKIAETLEKPGELVLGHTGRMRHKNGEWRWIEATGTNMLNDPDINGIIDIFRDVTDKVNESKKLQQNEELLASTLDAVPLHIALLDKHGSILTVNQAWREFSESYGPELIKGADPNMNYLDIFLPGIDSADACATIASEGIKKVLSGLEESFQIEYQCNSCKENRWFILHAKRFSKDSDKTVVSLIDISSRKKAEENLKASERKFRMLLEQNRDGIALIGADIKPIYASPSIHFILGYTEQEILEMEILSYTHPDDVPILAEVMEYAMQNPGVATVPKITRMRAKNGDWKYIEGTLTNMLEDPLINAIIDNFRDVTEITIAHEKLLRSNRFFSIISRINQIITQVTTELMFFEDVCKTLIELGSFKYASVILTDQESDQYKIVASAGRTNESLKFQDIAALNNQIDAVVKGKASFSLVPHNSNYLSEQYAGVCVPVQRHQRIIGVLMLEYSAPREYSEDEITLLTEIAHEISFTLQIIEKEQARKDVEKQLEIKNAKLYQSQAMANLGSWEVDLEKGIAEWSDEMLKLYGLPPDNSHISYDEWFEMVHPEDRNHFELSREMAQNSELGYTIAHRIIRRDGSVRHIISQLHLERDKSGKPTMMIGVAQDITDLQEIRRSLDASKMAAIESENRYRQIVEMANEGICLLNEENAIVFANQRFSDMLGYNLESVINKNLNTYLLHNSSALEMAIGNIKHNSQPDRIELSFRDMAGRTVWTTVALSAAVDDSGQYKGAIALISNITEKRNADVENRFKANLLNNIGQAVAATDKAGIVSFWNNAAEELYGKKIANVVGKHFMDVVDPSRREQGIEMLEYASEGKVWTSEIDVRDASAKLHTYHITARPIYDDNRQFGGMMAITTDITTQRQLGKLLKSSAKQAKLGHFEIELATNRIYRSDPANEILDFSSNKENDIENAINRYKEGESRDSIRNAYNAAVTHGTSWDIEAELLPKDGKERWARSIGQAEMVNGKAVRIFGSIQDISVQKASEKAVLDAFRERDLILESIGDAFFAVDKDWRVKYWNSNAESVLSMKREDILGKVLWDAFPEYVNTETYIQYHQAMETQTRKEFDEFYFTFQKWLQVSVYPSPLGLSIYFKEITERKLSELQLMELNENMQEYTNELVAVNRELNQFSYIVSHNLRAPVTNIMGLVEELSDSQYDAETKSLFIDALRTSAKRLNIVITDLNDVLQLKTSGINNKEVLELQTITEEVLITMHHQISAGNATVSFDFSAVNKVSTIRSYLHSILYNLILNAIKYKRPGVLPEIKIKSASVPYGIELLISDNGTGIDLLRTKNDLFGMYKRFHPHIEGKGIGLFMVKTQVEILGGTISVESVVGQGTVFRILLPD